MKRLLFSQRYGYRPAASALQIESMDSALRTRLWNVLFYVPALLGNEGWQALFHRFWRDYLNSPLDQMPAANLAVLKQHVFACEWHEVCSLLEFLASDEHLGQPATGFLVMCNEALETGCSGYRFVGSQIAPITSPEEIEAVDEALDDETVPPGVRHHLASALGKLSDRENPDYRNSVKESISAVEALCRWITREPKATLGEALRKIRRTHGHVVHEALIAAFDRLYGYASDEDGVRHAMIDEAEVSFAEAKFMLVACSAFVNYVVTKLADRPT